ncbi:3'-5' exonuclease [Coemansia interrupta]|uniref:RNA exonuclease 4 n=1 Tax=Coemansia interrupta TaxID=1126814 RepID=A0A9W8HCW5_9FUNG|nr:3'-5' exonuclease [Coemansia interrupta]
MRQDGHHNQHQQPGANQDHPEHHSHSHQRQPSASRDESQHHHHQQQQQQPRHSNLPAPVPHALSTRPSQPASSSSTPHASGDGLPAFFAYAPSSSSFFLDPATAARPAVRRPRSQKACIRCHRRKARCTRNLMEDGTYRCDNCIRDNIECQWRESKRRGPKPKSTASASPTPQRSVAAISNLLNEGEDTRTPAAVPEAAAYEHAQRPLHVVPPDAGNLLDEFYASERVPQDLRHAVQAYYAQLYAACPVLHPSTLLRHVLADRLDPLLRDALLAGAAALQKRGDHAHRLLDRIALAMFSLEDDPSLPQVCAFQLAATVRRTCCVTRYDAFGGAVARLVRQLGWHVLDRPADQPAASWDAWIAGETRRRVYWTGRLADAWHAVAAGHPSTGEEGLGASTLLPCPDALWDEMGGQAAEGGCLAQAFCRGQPPAELLDRLAAAIGTSQTADARVLWSDGSSLGPQLDNELRAWRDSLPPLGPSTALTVSADTPLFGSLPLLLHARLAGAHLCAHVPRILLHLTNRTNPGATHPSELLQRLVGRPMAHNLLALDVDAQSWAACVGAARECARVVRMAGEARWADARVPFCLFVAAVVVLRHGHHDALREDLRVLWRALTDVAAPWPADNFIAALNELRIEEALIPAGDRNSIDPHPRSNSAEDSGPQDTVVGIDALARRSRKRQASGRAAHDDADDIVDALLGDTSRPRKKKSKKEKKQKKEKPAESLEPPAEHSDDAEEEEEGEQYDDDVADLYAWSDNEQDAADDKQTAVIHADEPATFPRDASASSEHPAEPQQLAEPEQPAKPARAAVRVPQEKRDALGRYLAIDCEMVGGGPKGSRSLLARVSLVNYYGKVILDTFVAPTERVTDYRTWISGVRRSDLQGAPSFKHVQKQVSDLTKDRILVGHAIKNDLSALMLSHPPMLVRDTSKYEGFRVPGKGVPGLKTLAKERLGIDIQQGEHSSVVDAKATMLLYRKVKDQWEKDLAPRRYRAEKMKEKNKARFDQLRREVAEQKEQLRVQQEKHLRGIYN